MTMTMATTRRDAIEMTMEARNERAAAMTIMITNTMTMTWTITMTMTMALPMTRAMTMTHLMTMTTETS